MVAPSTKSEARDRLRSEVARILSHSLGSNLLPTRRPGPGKDPTVDGASWKPDKPWLALLLLALALSFRLYYPTHAPLCWLNLWAVIFVFIAIPLAYAVKRSIVRILDEQVFPAMSPAGCEEATRRLKEFYGPASLWYMTAAISAGWALVAIPALVLDLVADNSFAVWPLVLWLGSFSVLIAAAKLGCSCTFYAAVAEGCRATDLDEFRFAPGESPLVRGMEAIGRRLLGFMAFTALYTATLQLWLDHYQRFVILTLIVLLLGSFFFGLAVYVKVTNRLTDLVSERRQRSLRELQSRLTGTLDGSRDRFSNAHDLFDTMLARAPRLGVPALLRGAWPLVIQLVTVVVAVWRASG